MKKAFLLLIAVVTLAGIVWFNAGASGPEIPSVEMTVYSPYFTDVKAGSPVSAALYTADEELMDLSCVATAHSGYVLCKVPETYAGRHELMIQLTKDGVMYTGLVSVPAQ